MSSPSINADEVHIGEGTLIHPTAVICGADGGSARGVQIGDHCFIGESVQIRCAEFKLGDYSRIHHHTNIHGYRPCSIGHNAWIGQYTIVDSIGGTTIGDNCGIGAHSQLWSHIKHGDVLEGCRFLGEKALVVGKDVWFVGHCIVSPIIARDRSMAMVGSVITRDMEANHVYAGVPAVDITGKVGPQFEEVDLAAKVDRLRTLLNESGLNSSSIGIAATASEVQADDRSWFVVDSRTYTKQNTPAEVAFMKFLLPARAKFTPAESH